MKVDVSIAGISSSAGRARALALVREAVAKREAGIGGGARRPTAQRDADQQQLRGK